MSHYHQQKQQAFDTIFNAQRPVVDSLREFIANTVTECVQKTCAKVCLLTRSLNEIEGQDPEVANILAQNLKQLEQNLAAQIRRAQHQGEAVNQDDAMKLARFLAMGIYGMRTYAFTQPDEALLTQMGEQLLAAIIVD